MLDAGEVCLSEDVQEVRVLPRAVDRHWTRSWVLSLVDFHVRECVRKGRGRALLLSPEVPALNPSRAMALTE